jgi:hypothetical protein
VYAKKGEIIYATYEAGWSKVSLSNCVSGGDYPVKLGIDPHGNLHLVAVEYDAENKVYPIYHGQIVDSVLENKTTIEHLKTVHCGFNLDLFVDSDAYLHLTYTSRGRIRYARYDGTGWDLYITDEKIAMESWEVPTHYSYEPRLIVDLNNDVHISWVYRHLNFYEAIFYDADLTGWLELRYIKFSSSTNTFSSYEVVAHYDEKYDPETWEPIIEYDLWNVSILVVNTDTKWIIYGLNKRDWQAGMHSSDLMLAEYSPKKKKWAPKLIHSLPESGTTAWMGYFNACVNIDGSIHMIYTGRFDEGDGHDYEHVFYIRWDSDAKVAAKLATIFEHGEIVPKKD